MFVFNFKRSESKSEIRKVKIIYSVIFIVCFFISFWIIALISKTIITPIYESLGEGDFNNIEQKMEKFERISVVTKFILLLFEIFFLYFTIWACFKLGIRKITTVLLGIMTLVPLVSIIPFLIILSWKFSPKDDRENLINLV